MLDLKRIQENPDELEEMLTKRNFKAFDAGKLKTIIEKYKNQKSKVDEERSRRNYASKEIGNLISNGKKEDAEKLKAEVKGLGDVIENLEKDLESIETEMSGIVLELPNYPDSDVPVGSDEKSNIVLRIEGKKPEFDFTPAPHYEIGEKLNIIDFERGVKLAGSRFYSYRGKGAALERALINFMLDTHTKQFGYSEMWVPQLINDEGMTVTGQYPKFKGEYYRFEEDGLSLIPTAEVPLVNLYRGEIIEEKDLPVAMTAASSCFRREAGSAGKDTRGLVRVHQFQKVELVQIVHPEHSRKIHEEMLSHAEEILKKLNLHYRVLLLCTGDMGATAAKTYDLEVWMPGLDRFVEISSISNCLDFQARRGLIRYRPDGKKNKPVLTHTLNGSGLAAGRTLAAVMETYQKIDGSFDIPDVLKKYL
ncbi:MAG: serine--tRNA ligase [Spirochaetia bacterium]|nr:serine--tRNA ligase [Spirochaetia bacterium]